MSTNQWSILGAVVAAALTGIGQGIANGSIPIPAVWGLLIMAVVGVIAAYTPKFTK